MAESIDRFRRGFWAKETLDRPPVGIAADRAWQPIGYLKAALADEIRPSQVSRGLYRTDYEDAFAHRSVVSDDFMPFVAAWRAVPWLEAMCGCPVRSAAGSLAPGPIVASVEEWRERAIPESAAWRERLQYLTAELTASAPEDCWVSPTILRGVSDVLGAMRGLNDFFLDLHDKPAALVEAGERINRLHLDVLKMHFSLVRPKMEGYGHIFGYWAPGPTTVIQEDALGMCGPSAYRDLFEGFSADIVRRMGEYVLFHLHSTGYRHWRHVLEVPGMAGLELTVETNGPALLDMVGDLRKMLERSRLILMIDGWFEQLRPALRQLPKEGLYLLVSDKFIATEREFVELVGGAW